MSQSPRVPPEQFVVPDIAWLCLFLIIRVFDMISLFVVEWSCRSIFGDKPPATHAEPIAPYCGFVFEVP